MFLVLYFEVALFFLYLTRNILAQMFGSDILFIFHICTCRAFILFMGWCQAIQNDDLSVSSKDQYKIKAV